MNLEIATLEDIAHELKKRYGAGFIVLDFENRQVKSMTKVVSWGPVLWHAGMHILTESHAQEAIDNFLNDTPEGLDDTPDDTAYPDD